MDLRRDELLSDSRPVKKLGLPVGARLQAEWRPSMPSLHVCLASVSEACLTQPPAKILAVVCPQNVHVILIGFVRRKLERLRRCKPPICRGRINFSIAQCLTSPFLSPLPCSDFADSLAVQNGLHTARTAEMTLIVLVCCVHFPLVPRAVRSAHGIHYMHRHALEHIYRAHRPILKHHAESGYILICMMAMVFDKLGLAAFVKPVGSPAEPLCCSTKWLLYYLQAVQWRAA